MKRNSGVLVHISSLPGKFGIGTMGAEARKLVDLLVENNQQNWQILPLGPTGYGNSPYQCYSAFAGNPLLIDFECLLDDGLLVEDDLAIHPSFPEKRVDYDAVHLFSDEILHRAFTRFKEQFELFRDEYHRFLSEHSWWLDDYALFRALKKRNESLCWAEWETGLRKREGHELDVAFHQCDGEVQFHRFVQFLFFKQWFTLKMYANERGIQIIGDTPLYVSFDSSDVWANQDIFLLDEEGLPSLVGGVPPDYFSETGQLWGNPVFNWPRLKERKYDWWVARVHFNLRMFDLVRIDHFRGLESFWAIPADETTAVNGTWLPSEGYELLSLLQSQLGQLPVIAEDLGEITPEVRQLRDAFGLPGMKVLQFAFASDETNEHLPHNTSPGFIIYTGTHDNNTSLGWHHSATRSERKMLAQYIGNPRHNFVRDFMEQAWASSARTAIVPMQDVLELGEEARMNVPGIASGNWEWRFSWKQVKPRQLSFLKTITRRYNRR